MQSCAADKAAFFQGWPTGLLQNPRLSRCSLRLRQPRPPQRSPAWTGHQAAAPRLRPGAAITPGPGPRQRPEHTASVPSAPLGAALAAFRESGMAGTWGVICYRKSPLPPTWRWEHPSDKGIFSVLGTKGASRASCSPRLKEMDVLGFSVSRCHKRPLASGSAHQALDPAAPLCAAAAGTATCPFRSQGVG